MSSRFEGLYGSAPNLTYDEPVDPNLGSLMTVAEYLDNVDCGGFIDYDGFGQPVKDGMMCAVAVYPSRGRDAIPDDATHVVWYNR